MLLLEDNPADAELIEHALERGGLKLVVERVNGRDAFVRCLDEFAPQVVIADHSLGQFNARMALKLLQQARPATPMILVSGAFQRSVIETLRAGAEQFFLKSDLTELAQAVECALKMRDSLSKLSPRQLQVLRLVAEGHTTPGIAEQLDLSVKTVETHRGEIMKRLGIHDVVGLVRYAMRVGLISQ